MAKLTLDVIPSGYAAVDKLNENFDRIETALENTLSRDGTAPNSMASNLDMNNNKITNLPTATNNVEAVNLGQVNSLVAASTTLPQVNQTFTTYDAVRMYSGAATIGYVQSRVSELDGGAGVFRVDAADTTSADNGGTILVDAAGRRWKREWSGNVNAKWFGAKGDGVTDDTEAINNAVTYCNANGGGIVEAHDGTYMVNASGNLTGIQMKSGVYLDLTGAKLKALGANSANYRLVYFTGVSDCGIIGGEIEGDRAANSATGEQGHCVYLILSCSRILIQNVTISNAFGDGIYVGRLCSDVKINGCTVTNNRRNNISIVSASNVYIDGCDVSNANGTAPEAGIDIEPNASDALSKNIIITNCNIYGNAKEGISYPAPAPTPLVETSVVSNCNIYGNGAAGIRASYIRNLEITGCVIFNNAGGGILDTAALITSLNIDGNLIYGNTGSGIEGFASGSVIANNAIRNNSTYGIKWHFGQQVTISGNVISDHAENGIYYERAYNCAIIGNTVKNSQKHGIFITGTATSSVTRSRTVAVIGNTVVAPGLLTDNTYHGIYLDANANTCTVTGNTVERAASGTVVSLVLTNGGANYTSAPTVTISGGGGAGATATAVVSGGSVVTLTLTNAGSGYTSVPTVSFSGGGGTGAAATASIGNQPLYAIYAEDASVVIAGNMTNNGAKSGNTQVRRGSLTPASFLNSPSFMTHVLAERFYPGVTLTAFITSGTGSPEGAQSAPVGSLFLRTDGGASTTLYVKESGASNTGWVAK